jgi:filamentous hemagglutinin family protein
MLGGIVFRAALQVFCVHAAFGGIVLDGSFGTSGALPGPNYMISANFGKEVGNNLFHSFNQFNLISSESATFTGPSNIQNIVSRVTGGSPSSIDGKISSDIQGANLFFVNPSGVVFGPHAQLDTSGSVAISTAHYLKMADGGRFNANLGGGDTLTSAPVSAFGFLSANPAPVSVTGSNMSVDFRNIIPGLGLTVSPGKALSIVAGDIAVNAGYIAGAGARVNLISVRSPGEVKLDATKLNSAIDVSQFTAMGQIDLTNFTKIDTSGPAAGPIVIRAGNLNLSDSHIFSNTTGSAPGGGIDIEVANSVAVDGSLVQSGTSGDGNSGDVTLTSNSILITGSNFESDTSGSGRGGNIVVHTRDLTINSGSVLSSSTELNGNGGDVTLNANSILIDETLVFTSTALGSTGDAGAVSMTGNSIVITNQSGVSSGTGVLSTGNAGGVTLTANSILINSGSSVDSATLGSGNGGEVTMTANSLVIAGILHRVLPTSVDTSADGGGNAGDIKLTADSLLIRGGAGVLSSNTGAGNAGDIMIRAGDLRIGQGGMFPPIPGCPVCNETLVSTDAFGENTGNGGNITIQARELTMGRGGMITANALTNGGNIHITVQDLVYLHDASITATAGNAGGNITIDPLFIILSNSSISANASAGQGGNINLVSSFFLASNSPVTATGAVANGTVNITAPPLDLGAELITLPGSLVDAQNQLRERCTALLEGDFSSFISLGRGGTEPEPDELEEEF